MCELLGSGYVEKSPKSTEDVTGELIHIIIKYLNDLIRKIPFLIDGEETRGTYQQSYQEVVDVFEGIKTKYQEISDGIEICFNSEDVYELMRNAFYEEYDLSIERFKSSLNGIFPSNLAEANIPKNCRNNDYNIPNIKRWQHSKNLPPDVADKEYIRFTKEAKDGIISDLSAEERPVFPADFAVDYPERFADDNDRKILATLLVRFSKRKKDSDGVLDYERDLKEAKNILSYISNMEAPDTEQMTRKYIDATIEANYQKVRDMAESMAEEKVIEVLGNRLALLAEKLNGYEAAPELATEALKRKKKKKKRNRKKSPQKNAEVGSQNTQAAEVKLKVSECIKLDREIFPWLDEDVAKVLCIERGSNGTTVVVDARTEATKGVEHNIDGYKTEKQQQNILSIFYEKLKFAAKLISTSDSKLYDRWGTLKCRNKTQYPFNILGWKPMASDARRLYVSDVTVYMLPDGPTKSVLVELGISHLLMLLGICDKNHQPELLSIFTGRDIRTEAVNGAGK